MSERDPAWALGPGETYPPAPPLWECDDPERDCGDMISWAPSPRDHPGAFPAGWRKVWPPAPQVVVGPIPATVRGPDITVDGLPQYREASQPSP